MKMPVWSACCIGSFLLLSGCSTWGKEKALRILGCRQDIAPLVTDWTTSVMGIDHSACIRIADPRPAPESEIPAACGIPAEEIKPTRYPASHKPRSVESWWDLKDSEPVSFVTYLRNEGEWEGYAYRKPYKTGSAWLVCGSSL